MYWRLKRKDYEAKKGTGNKRAMNKLINSGVIPGILAFKNSEPVGWCSVAPRDDFLVLENSRILKRIDDIPVWSVVCLFIKKNYRNRRLSVQLLKAAKKYVNEQGGRILEGYPVEPKKDKMADAFAWTGLSSAFLKAGFKEQLRRSETRPIMRAFVN
ncbi:MAG: GNAT family N-acetyltransferase, partial [Ignavibacteria bacterium]|nr:GNAT family N-acetyltransferase [Ignavibacteria bacterium]